MVKPYEKLSSSGKARRLRPLALNALENYHLRFVSLRLVGVHTNTLFRVKTDKDNSFLLRVCRPEWRTDTDLHSEALWLQALNRNTDIGAPRPLASRDGEFIVEAHADGVPGSRRCMVMSWTPGTTLSADELTEAILFNMGVLFARLHRHGAEFSPPAGFTQRMMNRVLARDEEEVLFRESNRKVGDSETWQVLDAAWAQVQTTYRQLYAEPAGLCVIHNDLWHGNIKRYRGHLYPLDFEDTCWGYPVQDIAMAWQDLMKDVPAQAFESLRQAFRQGYESHTAWPESFTGQIDALRAGRMFWVANYVACYQNQYLEQHLEWLAGYMERFLATSKLLKPTS
jgi:Ser/Thr protein kinase RdoA (MazF antagonist)